MLIRSRSRICTLLVLLGILGLAGLEAACFSGPSEPGSEDDYCRQNPTHCDTSPAAR